MQVKKISTIAVGLSFGLLSLAASAVDDNCGGTWTNVAQYGQTIDFGNGNSLTVFSAKGSSTSENSPYAGVGECGGYILTAPGGKMYFRGACARKSKEGDVWSIAAMIEPGAERGTWTQVAGTGAFAGKSSSGWWRPLVDDGKTTTGSWGGNCQ